MSLKLMKRAAKDEPFLNYAKRVLAYDATTGVFTRIQSTSANSVAGSIAGNLNNSGYWIVGVRGKQYLAHRLAWLFTHDEWPSLDIDHINGNKLDNRIANLRLATDSQNLFNRPAQKNNSSGLKGAHWDKNSKKWTASICVNRKLKHIGVFSTPEAAHKAYCDAAKIVHGEFSCTEPYGGNR